MSVKVTAANFEEEVLKSDKPVVVDFWASWCGPCKMLAPVLEEIGQERPDLKICKVNVDEEMPLAQQYRVVSIPMLLVFQDGDVEGKMVGYNSKEDVLEMIDEAIV
jgi:thioredoxin 1